MVRRWGDPQTSALVRAAPVFRTVDDLTAPAVGEALRRAGAADRDPVAVRIEPIGAGVGLLGTLVRVGLEWAVAGGGPPTVVAKLPTTDPGNQAIVDRFGYDRREAGVYRDLLPRPGVRAPRCLAQHWDDRLGRGWLLLEDLGHLRVGDQVAGATDAEVDATVDALAAWHAAWWNDHTLESCRWLPASTDPAVAGYGELFDLTWELCRQRLGDAVDDDTAAAALAARATFDSAVQSFASGPRTLVHGDARLDNVRFDNVRFDSVRFAPDAGAATLLDFQLATHGRGPYDLAFFCAGSIETADRRRREPQILQRYLAGLRRGGVHDYTEHDLARDYRLGHAANLPNPVTALVAVSPGDERGAELLRRNALRALAAVRDHFGTTATQP